MIHDQDTNNGKYEICWDLIVVLVSILCNIFYNIVEFYLSFMDIGMISRTTLKYHVPLYIDYFIFMLFH